MRTITPVVCRTGLKASTESIDAAQWLSTALTQIHGGFTTCAATCGSGSRIAGTIVTIATRPTAAHAQQAIAASGWSAGVPGSTYRNPSAQRTVTGTHRTAGPTS